GKAGPVAPPLILGLFLVVVVVVVIAMFVAGVGPFATKKAQQPGVEEEGSASRPLHDMPHREQFLREKWRMFPPAG
ncbi:MAG: hypothetical protein M3301_05445, partial [Chloroflexota bacterium]|nr:hypothetical protein [Chloroflexota bacterium]